MAHFTYDPENKIVDIYVDEDETCPVAFLHPNNPNGGRRAHEGVPKEIFLNYVRDFLIALETGNLTHSQIKLFDSLPRREASQ